LFWGISIGAPAPRHSRHHLIHATLIALAERTGVTAIATIDQRDFSIYRLRGRKRFRILLER
jgi:hypothetical protein